jgi:hypothetical protein
MGSGLSAQRRERFLDARGARLGPFGLLDGGHPLFAVARREGFEAVAQAGRVERARQIFGYDDRRSESSRRNSTRVRCPGSRPPAAARISARTGT